MQSAAAYERFARVYDRHWGSISLNWLGWLALLLVPRLPAGALVLDVCCGTGQMAGEMARRGYRMVGLDGAPAMLRYARVNAPTVSLIQADVRRFALRPQFDAAYCIFDSLNHLLSTAELSAAFLSICSCLRPGGWFLFDVNTEPGYVAHWRGTRELTIDGARVRTRSDYDVAQGLALFRARIGGRAAGGKAEEDVVLLQRCHSAGDIHSALKRSGFSAVEAFGVEDGAIVAGRHPRSERSVYLCRRRTRQGSARTTV